MTVTTGQSRTNQPPASAVVVNPSKVDDLEDLRRVVDDTLARAGWPAPQWLETTPDDPGMGQTRTAIESGAEVVFVCGGDGTVMSAVSGPARGERRYECRRQPAPSLSSHRSRP